MKRFLLLTVIGIALFAIPKDVTYPTPVMRKANFLSGDAKAPSFAIDTSLIVNTGATTREVGIGKYFKAYDDDTIRVVGVQSATPRYLYIATDTSTTGFGDNKFMIETPYAFSSGSTPHAIAVGTLGPSYWQRFIFVGQNAAPYSFFMFGWNSGLPGWALYDSIPVGSAIYDIAIGPTTGASNYYNIFVAASATTPSSQILRLRYNGVSFADSERIYLTGTQSVRGIAVGDIRSDIPGDEVYVVGGTNIWMVYWNDLSASWQSEVITTGVSSAVDVAVGDVDPTHPGNELVVVHGSTSYQLSIWYYDAGVWSGYAWNLTGSSYTFEVAIGDVITQNPGNEIIFTTTSSSYNPILFWIAPNGSAWARYLPKNAASSTDYGIAIGDVNRWRQGNEYVLSGGNRFYEGEQILTGTENDLMTYYFYMSNPIAKNGEIDYVNVYVFNPSPNTAPSFDVGYYFKNHPTLTGTTNVTNPLGPQEGIWVQIPVESYDFIDNDTLIVYTSYPPDLFPYNDTTKMFIEVWDDSTVAASGFNWTVFPPYNSSTNEPASSFQRWTRYILSGLYNWSRTTSPSSPTAPVLEGSGVAMYPSFNATSGSSARLLTNRIDLTTSRKVILDFYMYHDNGLSTFYDSIYVEYGFDTLNFTTVAGFQRYYSTNAWQKHTVEIGDFSGGTQLYIGFRAVSKYGNNMFIDSVRVFTTAPTAPAQDAGITAITLPNPPYIVGASYPVTVTIKNCGLDPITSCPVYYTWNNNSGAPVSETWTGNLLGGQSTTYTFTTLFTPNVVGNERITAWTELPGDGNPANDTTYKDILICPEYHTLPYMKDFEEGWTNSTNPPFCGWTIIDGGSESPQVLNNNDWHKYLYSSRNSNVARIYYSPVEWSDDWLISPRLDCSGYGTYTLKFWHYYNDFSTTSPDSGRVLVSTDNGSTWTKVAMYSNADDSGYKTIDITPYVNGAGTNVKIGFHYVANDEYYWYIDSFSVDYVYDGDPPLVNVFERPQNTYNDGPYIVRATIHDISPIYTNLYYAIAGDSDYGNITPSSVVGDTYTFEIPDQSSGKPIMYYVWAQDANGNTTYSDYYSFMQLEPIGQDTIIATAMPDSSVKLNWLNPWEQIEYYGEPYYAFPPDTGFILATQFIPQYTPCRLDAFYLLFYGTAEPIRLIIFDDNNGIPQNVVFDTILTPNLYPNYTTVELLDTNIVLNGDFHIGAEWLSNNQTLGIVSDNTSSTFLSKYYDLSNWHILGYDLCIGSIVEYLPHSKAHTGSVIARLEKGKDLNLHKIDNPITLKLPTPKYINTYEVLRRNISYPTDWIVIGTSTNGEFIDSATNLTNNNFYQYAVRTVYTNPDSVSEISPPREIGIDWTPPQYSNMVIDTTIQNYMLVGADIFDWLQPLAYDSLFYSINGGSFVGVTHDSIQSSNTYWYTIPLNTKAPTNVQYYFTSKDISEWGNASRDPIAGYYEITVGITEKIPDKLFLNISSIVSGRLTLDYGIPKNTNVKFTIYNTIGQKVTTIDKGMMKAGYYNEKLNLNIPGGVYFIKMETGEGKIINKVLKVF